MPDTVRQHEMAEWQLSFQVARIAEATIPHDRWGWLRAFSRDYGDLDRWIEDLAPPTALAVRPSRGKVNRYALTHAISLSRRAKSVCGAPTKRAQS